ncbi:hypothetical protein JL720_2302 [Aureococcus anophagefferens]|nr:hypothetical protein JL720_2302 [Aureococcus anophagefferens]
MSTTQERVDVMFADGCGAALVARLARATGTKALKAKKVLFAYKQFLVLKAEGDDFDATKLSPPSLTPARDPPATTKSRLKIGVKSLDGKKKFFMIKNTTPLYKVFDSYSQFGFANDLSKYIFRGRRLRGEETPEEIGMEDGDDAMSFTLCAAAERKAADDAQ